MKFRLNFSGAIQIPPLLRCRNGLRVQIRKKNHLQRKKLTKKLFQEQEAVSGTGTDRDGYLFAVKGDRPPRPVFSFDLRKFFPYEARRANITNKVVVVRVQVDDTGKLNSSSVVSAAAGYGFDEAAIEVLSRARFIPGYKDGLPVKMVHDLAIRFVLD